MKSFQQPHKDNRASFRDVQTEHRGSCSEGTALGLMICSQHFHILSNFISEHVFLNEVWRYNEACTRAKKLHAIHMSCSLLPYLHTPFTMLQEYTIPMDPQWRGRVRGLRTSLRAQNKCKHASIYQQRHWYLQKAIQSLQIKLFQHRRKAMAFQETQTTKELYRICSYSCQFPIFNHLC